MDHSFLAAPDPAEAASPGENVEICYEHTTRSCIVPLHLFKPLCRRIWVQSRANLPAVGAAEVGAQAVRYSEIRGR